MNVIARCRFRGGPGRAQEAAEAWAFELTYYFLRGVGEAPRVTYSGGVYTCEGLMSTTHPYDRSPVTDFDSGAEPWDLDFCVAPGRRERLRKLYTGRQPRWDDR